MPEGRKERKGENALIFMSRRRKMFHGSRGIGGGPFTPTMPRRVASRRVVPPMPDSLILSCCGARKRAEKKKEYAVGDRLYRLDLSAHTRRNGMLLHQSERFITQRVCVRRWDA